jgi:hypothetical protein
MKKVLLGILVLLSTSFLGACGSDSNTEKDGNASPNTEEKSKNDTADSSLLKNNDKFKYLAINNGADNAKIVDQKDYKSSWTDSSWSGVNISIDEVTIIKLENYQDYSNRQYPGFIIVHYIIDNAERDISIYPEQATMSTNTGEQSEGDISMTGFAGDLMSGTKVNGYAAYSLNNLDDVNAINQIRLKFNANYSTDNYDDENANHEYDVTLDLQ